MARRASFSILFALFAVATSSLVSAQEAAPRPPADDDLEVPSREWAAPSEPPPAAPSAGPAPSTQPSPAPSSSASPPASPVAPASTTPAVTPAPPVTRVLPADASSNTGAGSRSAAAPASAVLAKVTEPSLGVRIGGYLQGEYQHHRQSEDQLRQGGTPLNLNRFLVRRARIRFDRDWQYAAAAFEFDTNTVRGVSVGIRRAEAALVYRGRGAEALTAPPLVALTLGVTDIPFGADLLESARSRAFMERSLGSVALFPSEADAGVKVSGAVSFLRYGVALMNGEPLDNNGFPRDPNSAKDLIARVGVDVEATPALRVTAGTSTAKGKGFHPGQDARKSALVWQDINGDGRILGTNGALQSGEISVLPGSAASPSENYDRWALGLDAGVALKTPLGETRVYGEAFVASNYDRGLYGSDPITTGVDVRQLGAYGAVLQEVARYGLVGFRGGLFDPNSDVLEQRRGRIVPLSQSIVTLSPLAGLVLKSQAKLLFQYDFVLDKLARDERGVPADAKNDQLTVRLQVEL
jgi:hypothetical protein